MQPDIAQLSAGKPEEEDDQGKVEGLREDDLPETFI
jgi:hypothetical protein